MKILVTGGNGQLGRCLQDRLQYTDYEWQAPDQNKLDITDKPAIATYFKTFRPDIVINAAAYTAVDKAESDQENAHLVNTIAPGYLADACQLADIPLIHVSTDYVFDGTATVPYQISDQTNPQSVYGRTKLAGEQAVQAMLREHIIIRTAWVFSEYGNNFVKTMLKLANSHPILKIVGDQYGCPTSAGDLADAILQIAKQIQSGQKLWGLYHYCGDQITSWHGFARAIFDEAKVQGAINNIPQLRVINTDEYPVAAPRPQYSALNCQLSLDSFNLELANWREALVRVIHKI